MQELTPAAAQKTNGSAGKRQVDGMVERNPINRARYLTKQHIG